MCVDPICLSNPLPRCSYVLMVNVIYALLAVYSCWVFTILVHVSSAIPPM